MVNKKARGVGSAGTGRHNGATSMANLNQKPNAFQGQKVFSFPVIKLSVGLYQILLKIASFKGIPLQDFAESELRKIALENWDFTGNKPLGK